jgi:glutamate/tyrosine decarboxylase-like PLP-dependent enzyme
MVLNHGIEEIVKNAVVKQFNAIGTHTQREESEGGFEQVQEAEREYLKFIGKLFLKGEKDVIEKLDGYLCSGGTEANIQGLWVLRNLFLKKGKKRVHVYYTQVTHYSIVKACDILTIPIECQHVVEMNKDFSMDPDSFTKALNEMDEADCHILVLTLGTTLTGSWDDVKTFENVCGETEHIAIHIDAAFGGFTIPFVSDIPVGFEHPHVQTIGLDAHKMGQLPYPAGIFLCRKGLQKAVEIHVSYILGHADDTLIGSRSGVPALLGQWFLRAVGFEGQKELVMKCIRGRDELKEKLEKVDGVRIVCSPKYVNMLAFVMDKISEKKRKNLEEKYLLRSTVIGNDIIYKIPLMPHNIDYIDVFVGDIVS